MEEGHVTSSLVALNYYSTPWMRKFHKQLMSLTHGYRILGEATRSKEYLADWYIFFSMFAVIFRFQNCNFQISKL